MYGSKVCLFLFTIYCCITCVSVFVAAYLAFSSRRDPFSEKTPWEKRMSLRQGKRTLRYRSTAKSRIFGMTVGDIRYCFQQLRGVRCGVLTPYFILYNGLTAGEFSLMYLIETSNNMKNRRKRKKEGCDIDGINRCNMPVEGQDSSENPVSTCHLIPSQLPKKTKRSESDANIRVMDF